MCFDLVSIAVYVYLHFSSLSPFNTAIKTKIVKEIVTDENNHYKEKQVKGLNFTEWSIFLCSIFICVCIAAVQRKYESLRRSWKLGEDESCKEHEVKRGQEKKYRARKKRV